MSKVLKFLLISLSVTVLVGFFFYLWIIFKPLEKKNKSGLQVITGDDIAAIFLNGEYLGDSPFLTKDLKPGNYSIRLEPKNKALVAYETSINLRKGLLTVITWKAGSDLIHSGGVIYELEKLSNNNHAELSLLSIPDGAIVSIDSANKNFAPIILDQIAEGKHDLEISLPSYESQSHSINVVKGHRLNILVKLAKSGDDIEDNKIQAPAGERETSNSAKTGNLIDQVLGVSEEAEIIPLQDELVQEVLIKKTGYFENGLEVLKARENSNSGSKILATVQSGQNYPFATEETISWIKIKLPDGRAAWVSKDYAELLK